MRRKRIRFDRAAGLAGEHIQCPRRRRIHGEHSRRIGRIEHVELRPSARDSDDRPDHFTLAQRLRALEPIVNSGPRIDAEQMINGRRQIGGLRRIGRGVCRVAVAAAVDENHERLASGPATAACISNAA